MQCPIFGVGVNYVEIYVMNKKKQAVYDTNVSELAFNRILENVRKLKYKSFKKENTKTYNSRMEFVTEDSHDNVFDYTVVNNSEFAKNKHNFLCLKQRKKTKAVYTFPSNEKIYDIIHNHRYSFKLNNLVYLNFQISEDFKGNISREIFFNINYGRSCDENMLVDMINKTVMAF